jgi:hypothetical protein
MCREVTSLNLCSAALPKLSIGTADRLRRSCLPIQWGGFAAALCPHIGLAPHAKRPKNKFAIFHGQYFMELIKLEGRF